MKKLFLIGGVVVLAMGVVVGGASIAASFRWGEDAAPPPLPATPVVQQAQLLYAQPYLLDEGYTHWWRAEHPTVDAGWLLVLAVEADLVHPRQGYQPVLYVGDQTAERVNVGFVPGELPPGAKAQVVALVPAPRNAQGDVALDLSRSLIWFGTPALPEEVDAAQIVTEQALALSRGIAPPRAGAVRAAVHEGGGAIYLPDYQSLMHHSAELILRYSPGERDLVEGLTAPPPEQARFER